MEKRNVMKKLIICLAIIALVAVAADARRFSRYQGAKYVFFFIGDGMASPQIHATEAYLAQSVQADNPDGLYDGEGNPASLGTAGVELLNMSTLPVVGLQMTYADNRFITGSAASATALSSGKKSSINTIAMDPTKSFDYTTVAELAKQKGMKVGIVSSVSIDHATPACYYAHQPERGNYWHISNALSDSGFDYFGGGGMKGERVKGGNRHYAPGKPVAEPSNDPIQHAIDSGYVVAENKAELQAANPGDKVFAYSKNYIDGSWALPYEMDRDPQDVSIAEYTSEGIRLLDNPNGFFMMVEGGKIDWACHANDAMAAIQDTIAFDEAIEVALDFYEQHPNDTLIVVTGDHECGGLTLGFAGTGYETAFEILNGQTMSYEMFDWTLLADHKAAYGVDPNNIPEDMNQDIKDKMLAAFGLNYDSLTDYEKELIEGAYDKTMKGESVNTPDEDTILYYYYEPFTVTCTHIMNRRAGIDFTSYSHTALPVPVFAIGREAYRFDGKYENTELAVKTAAAMRVNLNN